MKNRFKIYSLLGLVMILVNWYTVNTEEVTETKTIRSEKPYEEVKNLINISVYGSSYDPSKRIYFYEHQEVVKVKKSFVPFKYNTKVISKTEPSLYSKSI